MITAVGCDPLAIGFSISGGTKVSTPARCAGPGGADRPLLHHPWAGGTSFDYRRAGSAASRLGSDGLDDTLLTASAFLHVSAISQAIGPVAADAVFAAMETVRAAGGRVAYDTNLRLKPWPLARAQAIIGHSLAMVDIALPGMDDARLLTGLDDPDAIVDWFLARGVATVALTLGSEGVVLAAEGRRARLAGHKVATVDATAAGDTFDGVFLAALAGGVDPFAAAERANAAAALSTTGYGGVAPIPDAAAVRAFTAGASGRSVTANVGVGHVGFRAHPVPAPGWIGGGSSAIRARCGETNWSPPSYCRRPVHNK